MGKHAIRVCGPVCWVDCRLLDTMPAPKIMSRWRVIRERLEYHLYTSMVGRVAASGFRCSYSEGPSNVPLDAADTVEWLLRLS